MNDNASLQLDRVEPSTGATSAPATGLACRLCSRLIADSYYDVNGAPACRSCHATVLTELRGPVGVGRFFRAALFGFGAAVAGSLLWYAVTAATGYQIGLVAIVVGFLVGAAVRRGGRGRGGWKLQGLAMVLTYFSICASYMPLVVHAMSKGAEEKAQQAPKATATAGSDDGDVQLPKSTGGKALVMILGLFVLFGLACAAPFLAGAQNFIGILLIGFAIYEAWKINKARPLVVTGPYRVGGGSGSPLG